MHTEPDLRVVFGNNDFRRGPVNVAVIRLSFSEMNGNTQTDRRWRLKFGLRALLLATTVAANCIWFGAAYSSGSDERRAADWVLQQNGHITYDYQVGIEGLDKPPATDFLRQLLGIEFFSSVHGVCLDNKFVTDLSPLTRFRDLKVLAIHIDILPEADLSLIAKLNHLEQLYINYTSITSRQLADIESLRRAMPRCKIEVGSDVIVYR